MPYHQTNYTPRLQQVLALARIAALRERAAVVRPIHFLLGIARLGQGVAFNVIEKHHQIDELMRFKEAAPSGNHSRDDIASIGFSEESVVMMTTAVFEAVGLKYSYISTEHLLLALAKGGTNEVDAILVKRVGVTYDDALKDAIRAELSAVAKA